MKKSITKLKVQQEKEMISSLQLKITSLIKHRGMQKHHMQ